MKKLIDIPKDELKGRRVLVRVGFDVPVMDGVVTNDFRIREALPTLEYLRQAGAKIILLSHIGRDRDETLEPVARALQSYLSARFVPDLVGETAQNAVSALAEGEVLLLGNLRSHDGETSNSPEFAEMLAQHGELYINEAFSVAHRAHASVVGIPRSIPGYAGFGFAREVEELSKAFTPTHPSIFVIGGSKFDTKLPLIKKFLPLYDRIFVCGALAHDLMIARGMSIGVSLSSEVPLADHDVINSDRVTLPVDVRVDALGRGARVVPISRVGEGDMIMDAGPESIEAMLAALGRGGTLVWNGPLGWYERGFTDGTESFALGVAESRATSIVGGGDTVASIEKLGLNARFTHVSTGGGAMLEFLERGTLPGIDALA